MKEIYVFFVMCSKFKNAVVEIHTLPCELDSYFGMFLMGVAKVKNPEGYKRPLASTSARLHA